MTSPSVAANDATTVTIRYSGARDRHQQRAQDHQHDRQHERDDQFRVAGVGLLDVDVLGRHAAQQRARIDLGARRQRSS